jgi:hypothetical protein
MFGVDLGNLCKSIFGNHNARKLMVWGSSGKPGVC